MRKFLGFLFILAGIWMMISPQAILGLKELKWMANYVFPGEVLLGMLAICLAYWLLDFKVVDKN